MLDWLNAKPRGKVRLRIRSFGSNAIRSHKFSLTISCEISTRQNSVEKKSEVVIFVPFVSYDTYYNPPFMLNLYSHLWFAGICAISNGIDFYERSINYFFFRLACLWYPCEYVARIYYFAETLSSTFLTLLVNIYRRTFQPLEGVSKPTYFS